MKKEWLEVRAMQVTEVVIEGIDLLEKESLCLMQY